MEDQAFEFLLLEAAEELDKKLNSAQIRLLKESHDFFKEAGLSDDAIKEAMGLTSHEMCAINKI